MKESISSLEVLWFAGKSQFSGGKYTLRMENQFPRHIHTPPDVVPLFSYIRGLLSIVRFYWFGSYAVRLFRAMIFLTTQLATDQCGTHGNTLFKERWSVNKLES